MQPLRRDIPVFNRENPILIRAHGNSDLERSNYDLTELFQARAVEDINKIIDRSDLFWQQFCVSTLENKILNPVFQLELKGKKLQISTGHLHNGITHLSQMKIEIESIRQQLIQNKTKKINFLFSTSTCYCYLRPAAQNTKFK